MNCVSLELLSGIVYSSNATTVWNDLKERFDKIDCSRIFEIHKEITTINQEFDSLAPTPGCDCAKSNESIAFIERLKLVQFLIGLNDSYEQARSKILKMIPVPSMNKAYSMQIERESKRAMTNHPDLTGGCDPTALMTTRGDFKPKKKGRFNSANSASEEDAKP
uniref:UBN2 domain-containing protein n=1 Tax=Nicotiana tabacum TaxID=4097 RepID=A0A1S3YFI8_TOBAC|nr:PREDICTED: uncharacterized protein LOC107775555 [Nicotiana tabacum]